MHPTRQSHVKPEYQHRTCARAQRKSRPRVRGSRQVPIGQQPAAEGEKKRDGQEVHQGQTGTPEQRTTDEGVFRNRQASAFGPDTLE